MPRWVRLTAWASEMLYAAYYLCAAVVTTVSWVKGKAMEDTNIEIVLAYLMVLGSPAAVWGTFITVIEGISGDLSSDEAKEAKKKRDKWQEEKKRHKEEEKRRREEIAANKEKAKNEVKDDIPDGEDTVDVIP